MCFNEENLQSHLTGKKNLQQVTGAIHVYAYMTINIFFSENAWPMKAKLYLEVPLEGGTWIYKNDQDGCHAHIWPKPL